MGREPTSAERQTMVEAYLAGATLSEAGSLVGRTWAACRAALRLAGFRARGHSEAMARHRAFTFNERYFESIDTEEKAYWLGFIITDGCVTDGRDPFLAVLLARVDRPHLLKLGQALAMSPSVVKDGQYRRGERTYLTSRVVFRSPLLIADLAGHGVLPRKSPTASPPATIPSSILRHFWRGAVDGDGCICHRSSGYWSLSFVGTEAMVGGFAAFVGENIGIVRRSSPQGKRWLRQVSYGGVDVPQQIVRLLYGGSSVSLDRKQALASQLLAETPRRRNREQRSFAWVTKEALAALKEEHVSWSGVARHLGVTVPNLMHIRRRLDGWKRNRKPYVRKAD